MDVIDLIEEEEDENQPFPFDKISENQVKVDRAVSKSHSEDTYFPDVFNLFSIYNEVYFQGILGPVSVEWSTRMTVCAGLCEFRSQGGCKIKLSEPLLKFRPLDDMLNTLLHEMIHAYLFLTGGNMDRDGFGKFKNSNISFIYLEVDMGLIFSC